MKPHSAKAKGRKFQQEVRQHLLESFPALHPDDIASTSSGASGIDLKLSPAAQQKCPFSIEAKCQEALNIWASLQQAEANATPTRPALLAFRRNRSETYVALKWADFLKLLKDLDSIS